MVRMTAQEVADFVDGTLHGDPSRELTDVAPLDCATVGDVAYVASQKQLRLLSASQAGVVLLPKSLESRVPKSLTPAVILVDDSQAAFVTVMLRFRPPAKRSESGISPQAFVSESAQIGEGCNVDPGASIGAGAVIGRDCDIHSGAFVGPGCRIGDQVVIHANAVLYHDVQIGDRVIIHATAVIGADGFGYRFSEGRFTQLPHTGTVILEDDVEIGAGTTVDRAMIGATVVGAGSKLDNQIMIAHNCRLGKHNALAGQVGFAGSVTTGDYVRCGGQVGVANHAHLGTGATIGAMAGISGVVPDGETYLGTPARPEKEAIKIYMATAKVPEMRAQLRELAATVEKLNAELTALKSTAADSQRAA